MKKIILLYTIMAICLLMLAGCNKKNKELNVEDVKASTLLMKNDGSIQAAFIEAFDKEHYDLTELNNYVSQEITKYNSEAGVDAITLGSLEQKDGNIVLQMNYSNAEDYSNFNRYEIASMKMSDVQNSGIVMPDTFYSGKDNEVVTKETVLGNDQYKVVVVNEGINVIVDGKIKYFSGGTLVDSSELQAPADEQTIIVYKP